jgi:hypothetical protein
MVALLIVLAFVQGGQPNATVNEAAKEAARLPETGSAPRAGASPEAPQQTAALPEPVSGGADPERQEEAASSPDSAAEPDGEYEVAQRSRRRRQEREEPPPPAITPLPAPPRSAADQARAKRLMARLVATYPDHLSGHDDNNLIWRDGTRMGFDDGVEKTFQDRLERPDVEDQFAIPYPLGEMLADPEPDFDPGRFRNEAFFTKMYGDCWRDRQMQRRLVDVVWLPKTGGGRKIKVTPINGVAEKLRHVSDELDEVSPEFLKFLRPIGGTFNCRDIANTSRASAHGFGIAIDLNTAQGDYWENRRPRRGAPEQPLEYRNRIPQEIVAIFEKHGFIWGGKWHHYDTAHFEYRPELLFPEDSSGDTAVPMPEKQPRNLN